MLLMFDMNLDACLVYNSELKGPVVVDDVQSLLVLFCVFVSVCVWACMFVRVSVCVLRCV